MELWSNATQQDLTNDETEQERQFDDETVNYDFLSDEPDEITRKFEEWSRKPEFKSMLLQSRSRDESMLSEFAIRTTSDKFYMEMYDDTNDDAQLCEEQLKKDIEFASEKFDEEFKVHGNVPEDTCVEEFCQELDEKIISTTPHMHGYKLPPQKYENPAGSSKVTKCSSQNPEQCVKAILNDYKAYAADCKELSIADDILWMAAASFREMTQHKIVRNHNRQQIMARCLMLTCLHREIAPTKTQIARFMKLNNNGMSRGSKVVFEMKIQGRTTMDIHKDHTSAFVKSALDDLGFNRTDRIYDRIASIVSDLMNDFKEANVCTRSKPRSKAVGATFMVLRRMYWVYEEFDRCYIKIDDFCTRCAIRKNTVEKVVRALVQNFPSVIYTYRKYDLLLPLNQERCLVSELVGIDFTKPATDPKNMKIMENLAK